MFGGPLNLTCCICSWVLGWLLEEGGPPLCRGQSGLQSFLPAFLSLLLFSAGSVCLLLLLSHLPPGSSGSVPIGDRDKICCAPGLMIGISCAYPFTVSSLLTVETAHYLAA